MLGSAFIWNRGDRNNPEGTNCLFFLFFFFGQRPQKIRYFHTPVSWKNSTIFNLCLCSDYSWHSLPTPSFNHCVAPPTANWKGVWRRGNIWIWPPLTCTHLSNKLLVSLFNQGHFQLCVCILRASQSVRVIIRTSCYLIVNEQLIHASLQRTPHLKSSALWIVLHCSSSLRSPCHRGDFSFFLFFLLNQNMVNDCSREIISSTSRASFFFSLGCPERGRGAAQLPGRERWRGWWRRGWERLKVVTRGSESSKVNRINSEMRSTLQRISSQREWQS